MVNRLASNQLLFLRSRPQENDLFIFSEYSSLCGVDRMKTASVLCRLCNRTNLEHTFHTGRSQKREGLHILRSEVSPGKVSLPPAHLIVQYLTED